MHFPSPAFQASHCMPATEWHMAHNMHSQPPTSLFAEPTVHIELNHTSCQRLLIILYSLGQRMVVVGGGGGRSGGWQDP